MTMPYIVVDKTQGGRATAYIDREWGPIMSSIIRERKTVDGDAFVLRDSLKEGGFEWGRDFYIQNVDRIKDGDA